MEIMYFLGGFVTASLIGVCICKFYCHFQRKFMSRKWYQVDKIVPTLAKDMWLVDFLHDDGGKAYGYCKKEPPADVDVKNLRVYVKHFNNHICLYHVHWEIFD
ncbi:MAG: hypothetical protein IJX20_02360 [Alphaproteobacteria bacterium]|nr:hypothetical protein [Alphaproteobacteria bacterium]